MSSEIEASSAISGLNGQPPFFIRAKWKLDDNPDEDIKLINEYKEQLNNLNDVSEDWDQCTEEPEKIVEKSKDSALNEKFSDNDIKSDSSDNEEIETIKK